MSHGAIESLELWTRPCLGALEVVTPPPSEGCNFGATPKTVEVATGVVVVVLVDTPGAEEPCTIASGPTRGGAVTAKSLQIQEVLIVPNALISHRRRKEVCNLVLPSRSPCWWAP
jgi:hypothetical protein